MADEKDLPSCDGWCHGANVVTHIGNKGYVYCAECGPKRRQSGYERTRRMTKAELRTLAQGQPLGSY